MSYRYFCAYLVFDKKEQWFSSFVLETDTKITSMKDVQREENALKEKHKISHKTVKVTSLRPIGKIEQSDDGKSITYFCSFCMKGADGKIAVDNIVMKTKKAIESQDDLAAVEGKISSRSACTGMLRLNDLCVLEGGPA